ncbi:hypothetical protein HQ393_09150 [Chitinibacter bivalviorum]|uniref:Imelysin-like domain-containing protein n=1 Tax=Chitinibacter bivalviorum TaxID=2739434 RepID=A0A7H9BI49_9NEIS|nr:imelysin family protein [Chitinibacter bivalviorum]QLG88400.1 hypothetical protein HQ393_09150 [Chitinibacter bivalviorum]
MSTCFKQTTLSLCLLGAVLSGAAWAEEELKRIPAPEFVQAEMRGVLLPAQRKLAATSAELKQASINFCAAPDAANFGKLQAQYLNTLLAWRAIEVAPMGPSSEASVGRIMASDSAAPDKILTLAKDMPALPMVDGKALHESDTLPAWGIGLKTIESLLYTNKPEQSIKLLSTGKNCDYLQWQGQIVAYKSETLLRAWTGFSNGVGYDVSYPRQFQTEYLNRLVEGAREIAQQKVGLTPKSVWQDQLSGATAQGLMANVAGMRVLLLGADGGVGLDDFLISRGHQKIWDQVASKLARLEAVTRLTVDSRSEQTAQNIANAANALADVLEKDVAAALNIKIGKAK